MALRQLPDDIDFLNATIGVMMDPETGQPYTPEFLQQAMIEVANRMQKSGYHFGGVPAYKEFVAEFLLGEKFRNADLQIHRAQGQGTRTRYYVHIV